jgi:lysophospholipase L1-like esterase
VPVRLHGADGARLWLGRVHRPLAALAAGTLALVLLAPGPAAASVPVRLAAGTAVVTAPPNLLSVNQASVESGLRGFARGTGRERLLRTSSRALVGRSSLELISTTSRSMAVRTLMQGQVVAAGSTYAASVYVRPVSTSRAPATARVQITFASSTGRLLSTRVGAATTTRISRWTRVSVLGARAPAGTASVSVWIIVASSRVGTAYVADAWGLWRSASVPRWTAPVAAPDSIRPTAPGRVAVAPSGDPGTLTVSWTASTDNVAVRRYRVTLTPVIGGAPVVGWVTGTRWTSGLIARGSWRASVLAYDLTGWSSGGGAAVGTLGLPAPTVNLLTANQSSVESSTAGFDAASGTAPVALARSTGAAAAGGASLRVQASGTGSLNVRTARNWTPAYPASPYSASVVVRASTGAPNGVKGHVEVRFYAADATVAPVLRRGPSITLSAAGWTRLSLARQVAPSAAQYVTVGLVVESAAAGQVYLADEFGLWRSTVVPTWATPPARTAKPLLVVLGDSYATGLGASVEVLRWSSRVASSRGWLEANLGRGGTGWATTAGLSGCGLSLCPTVETMAAAAVAARPDVVLVSAGRNDLAVYGTSPASVQAAIERTVAVLRAGLPSARIVVISPMWDSSAVNPGIPVMAGWAQQSAVAHGAQFVPDASSWLLGHPEWIFDGVHPDDAGYAQIADRVLAGLG